jgi:dihydrofolate reductase
LQCGYPVRGIRKGGGWIWVCDCPLWEYCTGGRKTKKDLPSLPEDGGDSFLGAKEQSTETLPEKEITRLQTDLGISVETERTQSALLIESITLIAAASIWPSSEGDRPQLDQGAPWVIGKDGSIPWKLPIDLRHFKRVTMAAKGQTIVMGRKTYESIGKPLPGRTNIVLTRQKGYEAPGCVVVHDLAQVGEVLTESCELMVVGGEEIYRAFLPGAQRIHLTLIEAPIIGDTFFPYLDLNDWEQVSRSDPPANPKRPYPLTFLVLERK